MKASASEWTRLVLLAALFVLSLTFVHLPLTIWAHNRADFYSPLWQFVLSGAAAITAGLLATWLLMRALPNGGRAAVAGSLGALGLLGWMQAYFLGGRIAVLNGLEPPSDFHSPLGVWDVPVVLAFGVLLAVTIRKGRRSATLLFLVLNIGSAATTAVVVMKSDAQGSPTPVGQDLSSVFRFSSHQNVLVILLDGLQSDVAATSFREHPEMTRVFEGFQFYRDTAGVAPSTFLSLPAIHSGEVVDASADLSQYFVNAIEHRSFMTGFADAGYDTTLINPIEGVCPARVGICTAAPRLLRSGAAQLRREGAQLLDLSLFRLMPAQVKRWIYDDGNWLVSGWGQAPREANRVLDGNRLLDEMTAHFSLNEGTPTLKFIHVFSTHTPYVLGDDCHSIESSSLGRLPAQATCGLSAVARLLERLKSAGVYDDAVILVLADHGLNPGVYDTASERTDRGGWAHLAGAANPVFLVKRRHSRRPMHEEPEAVHLTDVAATLCAATQACTAPHGVAAGTGAPERARRFNNYVWTDKFWAMKTVPGITPYDIRGALWDIDAWRHPGAAQAYQLGDTIHFGASGGGQPYLQIGWHRPDHWGTWTSGRVAHILLHVDDLPAKPLELIARVTAFVPPSVGHQDVTWLANGRPVETWRFVGASPLGERRLVIPRAAIAIRRDLSLQVRIEAPASPLASGMGTDPRSLGLALGDLRLVALSGE